VPTLEERLRRRRRSIRYRTKGRVINDDIQTCQLPEFEAVFYRGDELEEHVDAIIRTDSTLTR
jgi:hypothetical protein